MLACVLRSKMTFIFNFQTYPCLHRTKISRAVLSYQFGQSEGSTHTHQPARDIPPTHTRTQPTAVDGRLAPSVSANACPKPPHPAAPIARLAPRTRCCPLNSEDRSCQILRPEPRPVTRAGRRHPDPAARPSIGASASSWCSSPAFWPLARATTPLRPRTAPPPTPLSRRIHRSRTRNSRHPNKATTLARPHRRGRA